MKISKSMLIKIICCAVMVILIVGVIIGNVIVYSYELQLNAYLVPTITQLRPKSEFRTLKFPVVLPPTAADLTAKWI